MDETSSLMGQDEQDEQHLVGDCRHDEEIYRNATKDPWTFQLRFFGIKPLILQ